MKHPDKIVITLDHCVPPANEEYAKNHRHVRAFVEAQGIENFYDIGVGVCHQVMPEKGHVRPGMLILGADSHTTTYGALGAFSTGVGRGEAAVIWATGKMWLKVPETVKVIIDGELPRGVYAKDVMLYIIGGKGMDGALYRAVEFAGRVVDNMSVSERMILCNMVVEIGAKNGYVVPDEKTIGWLMGRVDGKGFDIVVSDDNAEYSEIWRYDVSNLEPQVACPHAVDNVKPVSEVKGTKIDQVFIGTCTNGRLDDLKIAGDILRGRRVAKGVRLLIVPASMEVYKKAVGDGIIMDLVDSGAIVVNPGCGPCLGAHQGVLAPGEVSLNTSNRNFRGRMGCREAEIYLSSPAVAAASAVIGKIADPREFI